MTLSYFRKISILSDMCSMINCFIHLQVILPSGVHREVDSHLIAYLSEKSTSLGGVLNKSLHKSRSPSIPEDEGIYEEPSPLAQNSVVVEKIQRRKSLQLRYQQQDWQVYLPFQSDMHIYHSSLSWHFSLFTFQNF